MWKWILNLHHCHIELWSSTFWPVRVTFRRIQWLNGIMSTQQKTSTQGKTRNLKEINFSESEAITLMIIGQDLSNIITCSRRQNKTAKRSLCYQSVLVRSVSKYRFCRVNGTKILNEHVAGSSSYAECIFISMGRRMYSSTNKWSRK